MGVFGQQKIDLSRKKKKDRCYFLETLSESIPPPKNKHVMRSLSPSIYCFYVYRVKGNKWSISFIKYLWTLFSIIVSSMNCYLFEFEDICGPLHIPPLINVIYQNTNAIGIAYFFLNCTCKFSRKLVVS